MVPQMGEDNKTQLKNMDINDEVLKRLNINPNEIVEYIENKKVTSMKPIHVKAHQYWKNQVVASS